MTIDDTTGRPRYMSPAWHYVRMVELGYRTCDQLEASFCAAHCSGDNSDAEAIDEALKYMKNNSRGGKREGAGRKPAPVGTIKVAYATKLTPEVIEFLRQCDNAAETIDETLRRSKAFREWKAKSR